jgi:exoribonuclease R
MIPEAISRLASLGADPEKVNRTITFSALFDSETGDIINYSVRLGLVNNVQKISYSQADSALNPAYISPLQTNEKVYNHTVSSSESKLSNPLSSSDAPASEISPAVDFSSDRVVNDLRRIYVLCQRHHDYRKRMGCFDFSIPRVNVKVKRETGIISVVPQAESESQRMVSECMIVAGRVASMFAIESGLDAPFRYHEANFVASPSKNASTYEILCALKNMNPSAISTEARPHDAMGLSSYCRSTSPLRRAFDLVLHQQIHGIFKSRRNVISNLHHAMPLMYTHEQFVKRLAKYSDRFWIHRYIQQELTTRSRLPVTCIKLDTDSQREFIYFIKDFAIYSYTLIPGTASLAPGTEFACEIVAADAFRGVLDIRCP